MQLFLLTQFWFHRFRKQDAKNLDHRRRLIDSFVNAIFLYDDRITFTFNYKDGSKTITFAELEKSGLGSDISALAAAKGADFSPAQRENAATPRRLSTLRAFAVRVLIKKPHLSEKGRCGFSLCIIG